MSQIIFYLKTCQMYALGLIDLTDNQQAELTKFFNELKHKEYWETHLFTVRDILSKYFRYLENPTQKQHNLQLMTDEQRKNEIKKDAAKIAQILFSQNRSLLAYSYFLG